MDFTIVSDHAVTIMELRKKIGSFNKKRGWDKHHNPKNISMSLAIEAAELMEHFKWITEDELSILDEDEERLEKIRDELADVIIYCMCFANNMGIDISESVMKKVAKNEEKYPKPVYVPAVIC